MRTLCSILPASILLIGCQPPAGVTEEEMNAAISELREKLTTDYETKIAALEARVTTLEAQDLNSRLATLEDQELDDRITALGDELSALTKGVDLTALNETVLAHDTQLVQLGKDVPALDGRLATLEGQNLDSRVGDLEADVYSLQSAGYITASALTGYALDSDLTTVAAQVSTNTSAISSLNSRVPTSAGTYINTANFSAYYPELDDLTDYLVVDAGVDEIIFEGANVYIQSGSGSTSDGGALTGLGNLIVGYADTSTGSKTRSGSHNLIVGDEHDWTSYGGVVFGYQNNLSAIYAAVTGGWRNTASGDRSSILGGQYNQASGDEAVVSGGAQNIASGDTASVSGGRHNTASGTYAATSGGGGDYAYGSSSSGTKDYGNLASGDYATTCGGTGNLAEGKLSISVGGRDSEAIGVVSVTIAGSDNIASGDYSVAVGGGQNEASGLGSGTFSGYVNLASNIYSSVTGGNINTSSGAYTTVTGGSNNRSADSFSVILGGQNNIITGKYSTIYGGISTTLAASNDYKP